VNQSERWDGLSLGALGVGVGYGCVLSRKFCDLISNDDKVVLKLCRGHSRHNIELQKWSVDQFRPEPKRTSNIIQPQPAALP